MRRGAVYSRELVYSTNDRQIAPALSIGQALSRSSNVTLLHRLSAKALHLRRVRRTPLNKSQMQQKQRISNEATGNRKRRRSSLLLARHENTLLQDQGLTAAVMSVLRRPGAVPKMRPSVELSAKQPTYDEAGTTGPAVTTSSSFSYTEMASRPPQISPSCALAQTMSHAPGPSLS